MPYPLTIFDYAFAVEQILIKLNIKEVNIVAHSFGARVAVVLASQNNIKVNKMVMFGPAGVKPRFSIKKSFKFLSFKVCKFLSKIKLYNKSKLQLWGSEDYKKLSPVMKKTFINIVNCDLKILMPLIKSECLVIIGDKDKQTPIYMGKIFCKLVKNCSMYVVKNCAHFCFLEKNCCIQVAYNFLK